MSVSVRYIVTQSMDKRAYLFKSSATYRAGGHFKEKQALSLASQKIMVDDEGGDFQASFPDIFAQYQNPPLTGSPVTTSNKAWNSWKTTPLDWWQCQLNFTLWCANAGCGVSADDYLQAKDPLLSGLYRFHVYYTTRHLLVEWLVDLQAALHRVRSGTYHWLETKARQLVPRPRILGHVYRAVRHLQACALLRWPLLPTHGRYPP